MALLNRAATYAAMGRLDDAAADAARGLGMLRSHGDSGTAKKTLGNLAQLLRDIGVSESTAEWLLAIGRAETGPDPRRIHSVSHQGLV